MTHISFVHSYRGGVGKSSIAANLAAILADQGKRVGIVDTNLQAPSLHYLFGLNDPAPTFNDYLRGRGSIQSAVHDLTAQRRPQSAEAPTHRTRGALLLLPASDRMNEIVYVWENDIDRALLIKGIKEMAKLFALDFLFVDTDPGLDKQTFFALEAADSFLMVMTPDEQDSRGAAATVQVARRLDIPHVWVLINKLPPGADQTKVRLEMEALCGCPVTGIFPHASEILQHASKGIFADRYSDHVVTTELKKVAAELIAVT
jgi:MinD-like ATPase involved in chromosome partitioning or flagellar assembly